MNEYMNKYGLDTGLNKSDKIEYNSILGLCYLFDTQNDIETQNKLYDLIKSIIEHYRLARLCFESQKIKNNVLQELSRYLTF